MDGAALDASQADEKTCHATVKLETAAFELEQGNAAAYELGSASAQDLGAAAAEA